MAALTSKAQQGLENQNLSALYERAKHAKYAACDLAVLETIASCLDMIADGVDTYINIGSTRKRDAFTFAVKGDVDFSPVYEGSLVDLGLALGTAPQPPEQA